jgi:hypothetical protein
LLLRTIWRRKENNLRCTFRFIIHLEPCTYVTHVLDRVKQCSCFCTTSNDTSACSWQEEKKGYHHCSSRDCRPWGDNCGDFGRNNFAKQKKHSRANFPINFFLLWQSESYRNHDKDKDDHDDSFSCVLPSSCTNAIRRIGIPRSCVECHAGS